MTKQTLYMDYSSSKALQVFLYYLINNGKVPDEDYFYLFGNDRQLLDKDRTTRLHQHYRGFYKMLSLLTLYDEIVIVPIKHHDIIDEGLLSELGIYYKKKGSKINKIFSKKHINNIDWDQIKDIMYKYKAAVLNDYSQEETYWDYWTQYKFKISDSFKWYFDHDYHTPNSNNFWGHSPQHILKTGEWDFVDYLDGTINGLTKSLLDQNGVFYSGLFTDSIGKQIEFSDLDKIDDCILALDLSGGIGVIPLPETIQEVIQWRNNADMRSFRSVFSNWMYILRNGDIELANKIQLDVKQANEKLDHIGKHEKINKNVFFAFIKLLSSQIPPIGTMTGICDFITPYVIDYRITENSWVNLPAFNSNHRLFRSLRRKQDK